MKYEAVIGIEVHAQLKTESKLFCGCSTSPDAEPNHHCCPICAGFPGTLPVMNKKAVDYVIKTALALGCEVPARCRFARKNYYYPDLPKAYQITQYEQPVGINGQLEIEVGGKKKIIRVNRVHLEEDTGKLVHDVTGVSNVDYNRTSVPLMEIVTEADVSSSEEAAAYLTRLRSILKYIDVSGANMEKGEMRCEPNISVRPVGEKKLGTKTELKNLNSFRAVSRGVDFEIKRQTALIEDGGRVTQETRRWDDAAQCTRTMRVKEEAHDYRYFPDPDLVPVEISDEWREGIRGEIPELPVARMERFTREYSLSDDDASTLTASREVADYYEKTVSAHCDAKRVANWIQTELFGLLNEAGMEISDSKVSPGNLAALLDLTAGGTISGPVAKDVFREMFETSAKPDVIVKEKGLVQVSDADELGTLVDEVVAAHPGPTADYRAGKEKAIGFLVGQVMKATKGRANPKILNELLRERLKRDD